MIGTHDQAVYEPQKVENRNEKNERKVMALVGRYS